MEKTKRITRATFKKFVSTNFDNLYINVESDFDPMTDCCESCNGGFNKIEKDREVSGNTLGVKGIWLVGNSRDYFDEYNDNEFTGIEVYNSCGNFIVALKKSN